MRFLKDLKRSGRWRRMGTAEFFAPDPSAFGKERVSFDGQALFLAAQDNTPAERMKEYIPEDESLDSWTRLAAIRMWPAPNDPLVAVAGLIDALKAQNPDAQYDVRQNPDTGEVLADFVTWPNDQTFVEFNVFSYARSAGGGLWAQQYALRAYDDDGVSFLKGLSPTRIRLLTLMAKTGLEFT